MRKDFYDKLGPARRWLASNVGRPWDAVFHELCTTFDRTNLAGNHVVEHMLDWVERGFDDGTISRNRDFVVDRHGILRHGRFYGRSYSKLRRQAQRFANGRRVAMTKRHGLWWIGVTGLDACHSHRCPEVHYRLEVRYHAIRSVLIRALTAGEVRQVDRIPTDLHHLVWLKPAA